MGALITKKAAKGALHDRTQTTQKPHVLNPASTHSPAGSRVEYGARELDRVADGVPPSAYDVLENIFMDTDSQTL